MVSNSKILTVSYGTFSCTLEGFDDSFDTMKEIAEYFRDLAADDRYFGAEPPSPDAEMLARIAERGISRRVEARGTDGRIHLRAGTVALPAAAQHTAQETEQERQQPAATPQAAARSAPAAASPAPARTAGQPHPASESIADKLRRIRAVAAPAVAKFPTCGFDEDEHAQDFLSHSHPLTSEDDTAGSSATSGAAEPPQEQEPRKENEGADVETMGDALAPSTAPASAPVAAQPEAMGATEAEAEAETTGGDPDQTAAHDDDDIIACPGEGSNTAPEADGDMAQDRVDEKPGDLEAMLRAAKASLDPDSQEDENDFHDGAVQTGLEEDALSQLLADAINSGNVTSDEADRPEQTEPENIGPHTAEADAAELADDELAGPRLAARVVSMTRTDLDAVPAGDDPEKEIDAITGPSDPNPAADTGLQRELTNEQAELQNPPAPASGMLRPAPSITAAADSASAQDADGASISETDPDQFLQDEGSVQEDAAVRAARFGSPASDAQAARIFEEADTQLGEPESNLRRSAIQHLRAAVAATKAEHRAGGAMQAGVDDRPYRNDLQSAVRPRRPPSLATGATPRPLAVPAARPAPLKLVAEQRIDTPTEQVRPRRITHADLATSHRQAHPASAPATGGNVHEAPSGFARFAEQMGATSLTDMLEAAAAYMADVEGVPQFSRPMLMQKLREAQAEDFSREDGLRSFGQLLRQGKLQKLKGGQFAVTSVTEFRVSA